MLKKKIEVITRAIAVNRPDPDDPVDVMAKLGGFEIAGIAGFILGAAYQRIPVVIDGFISTAGALCAVSLQPAVNDYIFASHKSEERGHRVLLEWLKQRPVLDLSMRLGEGTGAALGISMVEAGVKIMREVLTFDEAGVRESLS
jgi:nicotinate-nucleotide--dimethylbenzimidazole phosphoribosyltransferase